LGQQRYYEQSVAQGQDDYYSGRVRRPVSGLGRAPASLG